MGLIRICEKDANKHAGYELIEVLMLCILLRWK